MSARTRTRTAPRPAARQAADRRIAERRRQVARQRVRRRRRILGLLVLGGVLAVVLWRLSGTSLFGLSGVQVTGVSNLTRAEVVHAARVEIGQPVLRLDLHAVRRRVQRLPWVAHASVARVPPSGLRIEVTERVAAASVVVSGQYWLVSDDGVVLTSAESKPTDVPHVSGVPAGRLAPGMKLPTRGPLANALAAIRGMDPTLAKDVVGVQARSVAGLAFVLRGGGVLSYGAAERQAAKDEAALLLLRNAHTTGKKVVRIDVRAPRTPVMQAQEKSGGS